MASSNRHWPSMFKSKPQHQQWQNDITPSLISSSNRTPYAPAAGPAGCEERTPEPKPRWNPRPEQIRILEAIFNSGMVNPPRDEIRRIRVQLQEYGQVGDANVFYWFQNRKSRSKHKLRQLKQLQPSPPPPPPPPPPSSSSSSSNNSSPNDSSDKSLTLQQQQPPTTVIDLQLNSPTASVNQPYFHPSSNDFLVEPFFFPVHQNTLPPPQSLSQGLCFADVASVDNTCPGFLYSELMLMSDCHSKKFDDEDDDDEKKIKVPQQQQQQITYPATSLVSNFTLDPPPSFCVPSPADYNHNLLQGGGPTKSTVFINDVCIEVGVGPFNVREAFGEDAVLIESTGQAVVTNEWGVTLQPLQHGAFYYLIRPFAPPPPHHDHRTIDLI